MCYERRGRAVQFSILYKDDDDPLAGLLSDDDDFDDVDPKPAAPKLKVLPQRASNALPSDQSQGTWVINHKALVNIKTVSQRVLMYIRELLFEYINCSFCVF